MYHEIDYDDDSSNVLELAYRGVVVDLRLKSGDCCYEYKSDSNQNRSGIFSRNLETKLEPGPRLSVELVGMERNADEAPPCRELPLLTQYIFLSTSWRRVCVEFTTRGWTEEE